MIWYLIFVYRKYFMEWRIGIVLCYYIGKEYWGRIVIIYCRENMKIELVLFLW